MEQSDLKTSTSMVNKGSEDMQRISLQAFWYRYRRVEPFLPEKFQAILRRMMGRKKPNKTQLDRIEKLGNNIGLSRNEVVASLDTSPSPLGVGVSQRKAIYFTMLCAVFVVVWGVFYIWAILDPDTAPFKTYVPGTFYGTIKPQDFAVAELSVI